MLLGGILSAMQGSLESNKYEDFARALLGSRAYLLFLFDKLIISSVKQLLNLANDESCQKSFNVFNKFLARQDVFNKSQTGQDSWHHESMYFSHFASIMQ